MKNLLTTLLRELTSLARSEAGEFQSVRHKTLLLAANGRVAPAEASRPVAQQRPRATATVYYLPTARLASGARSG